MVIFENEGLLKVTGIHVHYKNVSKMVQYRNIFTADH